VAEAQQHSCPKCEEGVSSLFLLLPPYPHTRFPWHSSRSMEPTLHCMSPRLATRANKSRSSAERHDRSAVLPSILSSVASPASHLPSFPRIQFLLVVAIAFLIARVHKYANWLASDYSRLLTWDSARQAAPAVFVAGSLAWFFMGGGFAQRVRPASSIPTPPT